MSGGSYNYLCYVEDGELFNRTDDLERITKRLVELGHKDFAQMNEKLLQEIEYFRIHLHEKRRIMDTVWQAIEWRDSCDYGDDTVAEVLQELREKILKG